MGGIGDGDAKLGAIVRQGDSRSGVNRVGCASNIDAILLPLVGKPSSAGGRDLKGGGL